MIIILPCARVCCVVVFQAIPKYLSFHICILHHDSKKEESELGRAETPSIECLFITLSQENNNCFPLKNEASQIFSNDISIYDIYVYSL